MSTERAGSGLRFSISSAVFTEIFIGARGLINIRDNTQPLCFWRILVLALRLG